MKRNQNRVHGNASKSARVRPSQKTPLTRWELALKEWMRCGEATRDAADGTLDDGRKENPLAHEAALFWYTDKPILDPELQRLTRNCSPVRLLQWSLILRAWARQIRAGKRLRRFSAQRQERNANALDSWGCQLWLKVGWLNPQLQTDCLSARNLELAARQLRARGATLRKGKAL